MHIFGKGSNFDFFILSVCNFAILHFWCRSARNCEIEISNRKFLTRPYVFGVVFRKFPFSTFFLINLAFSSKFDVYCLLFVKFSKRKTMTRTHVSDVLMRLWIPCSAWKLHSRGRLRCPSSRSRMSGPWIFRTGTMFYWRDYCFDPSAQDSRSLETIKGSFAADGDALYLDVGRGLVQWVAWS